MNRASSLLSLLSSVAFAAGCGVSAAAPPQTTFPRSMEIWTAEAFGAAGNPRAALHLAYARNQVAEANRLRLHGEEVQARLVHMRATADAVLALELVHEAKAQADASEVNARMLGHGRNAPEVASADADANVADARVALAVAQRERGSLAARSYAYVALRGAERSVAHAGMVLAQRQADAGQKWLTGAARRKQVTPDRARPVPVCPE